MTMKLIVPLQKYLPFLQLEKKEKCCKVYTCSSKHRSAAKDTHFAVPNICGCYFRTVVVTATDCGVLVFRQPQHPPPPVILSTLHISFSGTFPPNSTWPQLATLLTGHYLSSCMYLYRSHPQVSGCQPLPQYLHCLGTKTVEITRVSKHNCKHLVCLHQI